MTDTTPLHVPHNTTETLWSLSIRYEGNDADAHQIDLSQLGASLQGLSRVLAVSAHFAQTGKYNKRFDTLSVKVFAAPVQTHNCYEVLAVVRDIAVMPELWSGFAGAVFTGVAAVVLSRGGKREMKLLNEALQKSLAQNEVMQTRMMDTVDKLIAALQPAAKQAHAPVGSSVESISIHSAGEEQPSVVLNRATKALVSAGTDTTIDPTRTYTGIITELDMISGTGRVALDETEPDSRIPATVTDPSIRHPHNPYVTAMAGLLPLTFQAKTERDADGNVTRLYISDTA